jgi:hypothetical protein
MGWTSTSYGNFHFLHNFNLSTFYGERRFFHSRGPTCYEASSIRAEKLKAIKSSQDRRFILNIEGKKFETCADTMDSDPNSLFCRRGVHYKQEQCVFTLFSDREITCLPFLLFTIVNMQKIQRIMHQ